MEVLVQWARALSIPTRLAFIFLVFGGAVLLWLHLEYWPLVGSQIVTAPIAGLLVFWGGSVILVELASYLLQFGRSHKQAASDARLQRKEVLENLQALEGYPLHQLVWVLRKGRQRFQCNIGSSRLQAYGILHSPDPWAPDIWIVHEAVWEQRSMLLEKHKALPLRQEFPHEPSPYG
jgi:hypothetical protein